MDFKELLSNFKKMLKNSCLTSEVSPLNHKRILTFQGVDSKITFQTEDFKPIELKPKDNLGKSFSIFDDGVDAYDNFIETLKSDKIIFKQVGAKSLEKILEKLLRKYTVLENVTDETITKDIKEEINDLKNSIKKWTTISPIDNFILDGLSEFKVGNISFKPTGEVYKRLLLELQRRINNVKDYSEREKEKTFSKVMEVIDDAFLNTQISAETQIEAESNGLYQLAIEEMDSVLNLLRCYIPILFPKEHRVNLGLRGEVILAYRPNIGFSSIEDNSWTFDSNSIGSLQPYVLNSEKIELMCKNYALNILSGILSKSENERSKLEKIVVTAIRWLGRGIVANDLAIKVLHLAAASENLIMGGENSGEITEKFSSRLAFLIEDDSKKRKLIYQKAKSLYSKRSKIIHSGSVLIDEEDVNEMEILTIKAVVKIALNLDKWKNHSDFVAWFDESRF